MLDQTIPANTPNAVPFPPELQSTPEEQPKTETETTNNVISINAPTKLIPYRNLTDTQKSSVEFLKALDKLYQNAGKDENDTNRVQLAKQIIKLDKDRANTAQQASIAHQIEQANKLEKQIQFPDVVTDGEGGIKKIRCVKANTEHLLTKEYNYSLKFNDLKKIVEYSADDKANQHYEGSPDDYEYYFHDICAQHDYDIPTEKFRAHLSLIGKENKYHPVKDYLNSLVWDGKDHLTQLWNTLNINPDYSHNTPLYRELFQRWMIQGVAAVLTTKEFRSEGVLLLQGGERAGKSTWFSNLIPDKNWISEGSTIDLSGAGKDSRMEITQHWLVVMDEIDGTFQKSEMALLKTLITTPKDIYRAPYDRTLSAHKRTCVFGGTINHTEILIDGDNRRWWILPIQSIDWNHSVDFNQVWAQAKHLWQEDPKSFELTKELLTKLIKANKAFDKRSAIVEQLEESGARAFIPGKDDKSRLKQMGAQEVLKTILGRTNPNNWDSKEVVIWGRNNDVEVKGQKKFQLVWDDLDKLEETKLNNKLSITSYSNQILQ